MIAEDLWNLYRIQVTAQTVENIYERGTQILKKTRDELTARAKKAPAPILDETTYKGEPGMWMLVIRDKDTVVFMHAQHRSTKELISQARDCIGIIIRDGYARYDTVFPDHTKQRCTQHIEREVRNIAERTGLELAILLYQELAKKLKKLRKWPHDNHAIRSRIIHHKTGEMVARHNLQIQEKLTQITEKIWRHAVECGSRDVHVRHVSVCQFDHKPRRTVHT